MAELFGKAEATISCRRTTWKRVRRSVSHPCTCAGAFLFATHVSAEYLDQRLQSGAVIKAT
jgi:hypothetical protein